MEQKFTKYEEARILGARALQLAMNAPLLVKIENEDLEKVNFDVLKIAEIELNSGVLPISIKKPFPKRQESKLKRSRSANLSDEKKKKMEEMEEENIEEEEGEIMELAKPEDEESDEEVNEKKSEIE